MRGRTSWEDLAPLAEEALAGEISMKRNNYQIVRGYNMRELEESVAMLIQDGWKPIGGIAVMRDPRTAFLQAMVKDIAPEPAYT
jgi:hypothetical protein